MTGRLGPKQRDMLAIIAGNTTDDNPHGMYLFFASAATEGTVASLVRRELAEYVAGRLYVRLTPAGYEAAGLEPPVDGWS